ncbi:MAG: hypothetical protein ABII12_04385 [Planctomycetota bacterium]
MFRFKVFENGVPAKKVDVEGAHLLGSDRVPLRAAISFANGEVVCEPRARGTAALALMWPVPGRGHLMLETTRLVERKAPYNLHVELARGELMRISQKREDWGLYDFVEAQALYERVDQAKALLVDAMTAADKVESARLGDAAIAASVEVAEAISVFHAELILQRRIEVRKIVKRPLGCIVHDLPGIRNQLPRLAEAFDFASLPFNWRLIEPRESKYQPEPLEQCLQLLRKSKMPIWGRALLSFDKAYLPEWLRSWARDYEGLRERVIRQIKYVLRQFGAHVRAWEVISGLHAHNPFGLSFEQIMDLTRTTAALVKQMSPRSKAILGIVLPWGEYYAHDPKTIPPLLYAEMVVESGINFDAFGLDLRFGGDDAGEGTDRLSRRYVRDMLHVSAMLDRFANLGKPLHVTATGVPSAGGGGPAGCWGKAWTPDVQAEWVRNFYQIAFSKPQVDTVAWHTLADSEGGGGDGLLTQDLAPKPAWKTLLEFRKQLAPGQS